MDLKPPKGPTSDLSKAHNGDDTYSFRKNDHQLGELVREQGEHRREGTQARCEVDEKGELLLRVNGDFVKRWKEEKKKNEEYWHSIIEDSFLNYLHGLVTQF